MIITILHGFSSRYSQSYNVKLIKKRGIYIKVFYHGTSDALDIKKVILPPVQTGIKREEWRKKYTDKVFFTSSLLSASMYAKKACKKYGGNPVVYKVRPSGQYFKRLNTEYISCKAVVIGKI